MGDRGKKVTLRLAPPSSSTFPGRPPPSLLQTIHHVEVRCPVQGRADGRIDDGATPRDKQLVKIRVFAGTSSLQGAVKLSFSWAEKDSGAVTTL